LLGEIITSVLEELLNLRHEWCVLCDVFTVSNHVISIYNCIKMYTFLKRTVTCSKLKPKEEKKAFPWLTAAIAFYLSRV
jgi:hypothetical protein